MAREQKKQPLLRLRFKGSAIHDGHILYDDLSIFVSNITLAIERIINTIQMGESIKKGRPLKATEVLSALEIVSVTKSSFGLALDLRRNGQYFPLWDTGEQAVDLLLQGFECIEEEKPLPQQYDRGVLMALRDAGRIFDRGIDTVQINSQSTFGSRKAKYTHPIRERVITKIRKYEHALTVIQGRLLMLDVKEDKLTCRLHPSTGDPIICKFDEELADQVLKYARKFIQVTGEATFEPQTNRIFSMNIIDIEPIEDISGFEQQRVPLSSFWKAKNLDDLATEQGVYPITDLDNLSKDWPEDADFESFLEAIRSN